MKLKIYSDVAHPEVAIIAPLSASTFLVVYGA